MAIKGFQELLAEANAAIESISVLEAVELVDGGQVVFVDVREGEERAKGAIPGSVHVPRGFLEFVADPGGPMHQPELSSGRRLILVCASGGRSALATKTLKDMGIANVANMVGGMQAWMQAGGPME